jgi:outer membrane protein assembly factor BamB
VIDGRDGGFVALRPDGTVKWEAGIANTVLGDEPDYQYGTPALGADGTVYFAGNFVVHAFSPDGIAKWTVGPEITWSGMERFSGIGGPSGSILLQPDGTIYVAGFGDTSYLWALRTDSPGLGGPWPTLHQNNARRGTLPP